MPHASFSFPPSPAANFPADLPSPPLPTFLLSTLFNLYRLEHQPEQDELQTPMQSTGALQTNFPLLTLFQNISRHLNFLPWLPPIPLTTRLDYLLRPPTRIPLI